MSAYLKHGLGQRQRSIKAIPDIPAVNMLRQMFETSEADPRAPVPYEGALVKLLNAAVSTIQELEAIALELQGDPYNSDRYLMAVSIRDCVNTLRQMLSQNYVHIYPGPSDTYSTPKGTRYKLPPEPVEDQ